MADRKVTELPELTSAQGSDVLYIIEDVSGSPTSKKITIDNLFADVSSNTVFNGTLTFKDEQTPTSNDATSLGQGAQGRIFFDQSYLYIAVSNTEIKRVALEAF